MAIQKFCETAMNMASISDLNIWSSELTIGFSVFMDKFDHLIFIDLTNENRSFLPFKVSISLMRLYKSAVIICVEVCPEMSSLNAILNLYINKSFYSSQIRIEFGFYIGFYKILNSNFLLIKSNL